MDRVKFGIDVSLNAAGAISGLNTLGQRLTALGATPQRVAAAAFDTVGRAGRDALTQIEIGAANAQAGWQRLAGTLGVPLSLGGLFVAVSGLNSLKEATIGANAELETASMRMAGSMRNWNDTAATAMTKSQEVMRLIREYAKETPFETTPLVNAASIASQVSRDAKGVYDVTKLGARLAAYKGTNDPTWSTQAIVSAMQGNYQSLQYSFGITANAQQIASLAAQMGGNTAQNRYLALKRLVEMRIGKEGEGDVVKLLAQTGVGVTSTLKDQFSMPLTDMTTAGYKEGVAALVRFSAALETFQDSPGFKKFQDAMSVRFLGAVKIFTGGLDFVSRNLERLPVLLDEIGPRLKPLMAVAGVILGVNVAVMLLNSGAGLLLGTLRGLGGFLRPFLGVVLNPLVLAGVVALTAALWPLVRGLDVGGQTVEKRWHGLVDSIVRLDLRSLFERPLRAIRTFLSELGEGRLDWGRILGGRENGFLTDLNRLLGNVRVAFFQALVDVFPEIEGPLDRVNEGIGRLKGWVSSLGVDVPKLALALGGVALAFRVLGLGNPWLLAAGAGLRGLATGLGLVQIAIANPLLTAGAMALAAILSPLLKDVQVFGKSVGEWMDTLSGKVAAVNWQGLFAGPLGWLRSMVEMFSRSDFSFTEWLKGAFAPGSILAFMGDLARPIFTGLLGALDQVFPELRGWFKGTFGNLGTVITDAFSVVVNVIGPVLDGLFSTLGPTLKSIGAVLMPLISFAWGAFSNAMHRLAEVVGSPGMQGVLRILGGLAGIMLPFMALGRIFAPLIGYVSNFVSLLGAARGVIGTMGFGPGMSAMLRGAGGAILARFPLLGRLAGIGPLLSTVWGWLSRLGPLVARLGPAFGAVVPWLARIGAFFVGGPIGWAVGIVMTLVGLGVLLYNRWRPFHDLVDRTADGFRVVWRVGVQGGQAFIAWFGGLPERMAASWAQMKATAGATAQGIYDALHGKLNDWAYWLTNLPERLGNTWTALKDSALKLGSAIYTALADGIRGALTYLPQMLSGLADNLPGPIKTLLKWMENHLPTPPAPADSGEAGGMVAFPGPRPLTAERGAAGGIALHFHAPLATINGANMTPEQIENMMQRVVRTALPSAINSALNNVVTA